MAKKKKKSGIGCFGILFILFFISSILFFGFVGVIGYVGYGAYKNPTKFLEAHKDGFRSGGKMLVGVVSSSLPFNIPEQELDSDAFDSFTKKSIKLTTITQDLNKKDQNLLIQLSKKEFLSGFMTEFYKWEVRKYDIQFFDGAFEIVASVEAKVLFPYIPKDLHPIIQEILLSAEWLNIKLAADFEYDKGLRVLKFTECIIGDLKVPQFFLSEMSNKLPKQLKIDQKVKQIEKDTKVRIEQLIFSKDNALFKGVYNPSK